MALVRFSSWLKEAVNPLAPFTLHRPGDYDVIVIGGGPSGLTAAINGASEKLKVLVIDSRSKLGGQARESWAIENYPGFPEGITGNQLFDRMSQQVGKFNTNISTDTKVTNLAPIGGNKVMVSCEGGNKFIAPVVVVATGVQYNQLPATLENFVNKGVYYGMPRDQHQHGPGNAIIVGGGNSAGQAALHLATHKGVKVKLVIRGNLADKMSDYLIKRIKETKNIQVMEKTEISEASGKDKLESVKFKSGETLPVTAVYTYLGGKPKTDWLKGKLDLDDHGFIKTWKDAGKEMPYETSMPGVFAIGDVRSGSTKRISAGVGEGSACVQMIHSYMERHPERKSYHHVTPAAKVQPDNPCRYPWQKAADGSRCGARAVLSPHSVPMRSGILLRKAF